MWIYNSTSVSDELASLFSKSLPQLLILSLVLILIFGVIYLLFSLISKKLLQSQKINLIIEKNIFFLMGIILGLSMYFFFYVLHHNLMFEILSNTFIFVIMCLLLITFSMNISFFIGIPSLIVVYIGALVSYIDYSQNALQDIFFYTSVPFIFTIVLFFDRFFFAERIRPLYFSTFICHAFFFMAYLIIYSFQQFTLLQFIQFLFYSIFICLLHLSFLVLTVNINKITGNAFSLKQSILYDDFFVKTEYSKSALRNYVKKNNISNAIIFKVKFYGIDDLQEKKGQSLADEIQKKLLLRLVKRFGTHNLFIKSAWNEKIMVMKTGKISRKDIINVNQGKMSDNESLIELQKIINSIPTEIIINNEKYPMRIKLFSSVYGIQSCDLNELEMNIFKCEEKYSENKDSNFFIFDSVSNQKYEDIINTNKLRREGKLASNITFDRITVGSKELLTPRYKNQSDEEHVRNINYLALKDYSEKPHNFQSMFLTLKINLDLFNDKDYMPSFINAFNKRKVNMKFVVLMINKTNQKTQKTIIELKKYGFKIMKESKGRKPVIL